MIKKRIKQLLNFLHLDLTKNLMYDRLTNKIIKDNIKKDDICVDIGCHLGEILKKMQMQAPHNNHYAFEPIPKFHQFIKDNFKVNLYPYALSKEKGIIEFNYVENAPEYSGIKNREYFGINEPIINKISVVMDKLDNVIPDKTKIDFIKIDVEGAEYDVLIGAKETILRSKPIIIFEFGIGASEHYEVTPKMMFNLLSTQYKMNIFTLKNYINKSNSFNEDGFINCYNNKKEFYFVASY